jgi:hypothetical protein
MPPAFGASRARAQIAALPPTEVQHVPIESARPEENFFEEHSARKRDATYAESKIRQPRERAGRGTRKISVRTAKEVHEYVIRVSKTL